MFETTESLSIFDPSQNPELLGDGCGNPASSYCKVQWHSFSHHCDHHRGHICTMCCPVLSSFNPKLCIRKCENSRKTLS